MINIGEHRIKINVIRNVVLEFFAVKFHWKCAEHGKNSNKINNVELSLVIYYYWKLLNCFMFCRYSFLESYFFFRWWLELEFHVDSTVFAYWIQCRRSCARFSIKINRWAIKSFSHEFPYKVVRFAPSLFVLSLFFQHEISIQQTSKLVISDLLYVIYRWAVAFRVLAQKLRRNSCFGVKPTSFRSSERWVCFSFGPPYHFPFVCLIVNMWICMLRIFHYFFSFFRAKSFMAKWTKTLRTRYRQPSIHNDFAENLV